MSTAVGRHDPYAALRFPEYRYLIVGGLLATMAILVQQVALGYELYKLTRDPLTLGFIGLAEAIPFIALALFGGYFADRYEKRRIMQYALLVIIAGSVVLTVVSHEGARAHLPQWGMLLVIYAMFMVVGFARGFYSPASSALRGFLLPREHYANGATWSSTFWQAGAIVGPVAAGFLYAGLGLTGALLVSIALFVAAFLLLFLIRPRPVAAVPEEGETLWQSLHQGLQYVWKSKIILYAISLDMFSVLFGGVVAILPIFAEDILKVGPEGLGLLRAAPAVGAMLTVLVLAWYPPTNHAWRNMLLSVLGFGLGTLVFALSDSLWLSLAALFFVGAADSVSVVIRGTILQTIPPEHLRGRVLSVNSIFVASSNELGAFESGLAARLMGVVPSVLFGSGVTLLTVAYVWRRSKELFKVQLR
ncbi:MFS transporter [Solimonas sp. SE-A11]|uniref:MFS transporter n=1 Tax=Solimonas sp. SE-A11 TaxID=3054954 RepID=UPI00259C9350|nr:MFS transporter [Solimonas sp. SE-A11]